MLYSSFSFHLKSPALILIHGKLFPFSFSFSASLFLSHVFRLKSIKYKTVVKNLRLATKYSFNVKVQSIGDEAAKLSRTNDMGRSIGQTIVVPTKSFAATASRCLQDESELVVETGPNFSGFITTDNGACTLDGDPEALQSAYTLHINHKKCGSKINYDDFTVTTVVTVQENSGILTHSSKKFIVKCTFQPDTRTVRARLALPSKKGEADVVADDDYAFDKARNARNQKWFMVDKSALIRKEEYDDAVNTISKFPNDLQSLPHTKHLISEEVFQQQQPRETAPLLKYTSEKLPKLPINFLGLFTLLMTIVFVGVYIMRRAFLEDDD